MHYTPWKFHFHPLLLGKRSLGKVFTIWTSVFFCVFLSNGAYWQIIGFKNEMKSGFFSM